MGHYYLSSITFPSAALKHPEIEAIHSKPVNGLSVDWSRWLNGSLVWEGDLITISDDTSSNGNIHVAELLHEYKIPYDHYHRDDNEGLSEWTDQYRLEAGDLILVDTTAQSDVALKSFAKDVLTAIQEGRLSDAQKLLSDVVGEPVEDIGDIAKAMLSSSSPCPS